MLDILGTAVFTLRVKVFDYLENLTSVWVMLAVKYCAVTGEVKGANVGRERGSSSPNCQGQGCDI